jgi:subtilisin family serine protease
MLLKYTFYLRYLQIIILITISSISFSQSIKPDSIAYRYWLYFKDKGEYKPDVKLIPGSEGWNLAKSELTEKALWRRSKVLADDELVSYHDIPVFKDYVYAVRQLGLTPNAVSKWMNAVSVFATKSQLDEVKKLGIITKIEGVRYHENAIIYPVRKEIVYYSTQTEGNKYDYGISYWQNEQIKVPQLHNYGITGFGVRIGMCDDGFNWRKHEALRTRRVMGEYDWIFKDDSVQNQRPPNQYPEDGWDQDGHGTSTFSTIGGFFNGKMIGPAFDSEFFLSKTEDNRSETPVEEDYWVEAVEWMEAMGVEVISCSLIYKPYDEPNNDYTYEDMDGNTTVIVRAADFAAYLGIVVCNSMGNEMQTTPPSIVSPPDGDSVIACGAVDSAGVITYFSSNGPTSDGKIKPDVVALGLDVWAAVSYTFSRDDSSYSFTSGTSFSCPLTAGVCALILSVHPELTPIQVREALRMTADRHEKPDNIYGWGLINAFNAALYYGMIMSNKPELIFDNGKLILSTYIISKNEVNTKEIRLFYSLDGTDNYFETKLELSEQIDTALTGRQTGSGKYTAVISNIKEDSNLRFYITASDSVGEITSPYKAPEHYFYFNYDSKQLEIF